MYQRRPRHFPNWGQSQTLRCFLTGTMLSFAMKRLSDQAVATSYSGLQYVIDFRIAPVTVEGLKGYRYSVNPWAINEVIGAQEADAWKVLNPRLWLISFNDLMIEVLFETVSLIAHDPAGGPQHKTLIGFCGNMV